MGLNNIKLNVCEIFKSIQGEGRLTGYPCVFVRMQGCNNRCSWCDTPYALDSEAGTVMSGIEIYNQINRYKCDFIEFTGGEPLLQEGILPLINLLLGAGYQIAVETGGSEDISKLSADVIKLVDIKCPGSGMSEKNLYTNISHLTKNDELKFVIADQKDFNFAMDLIEKYHLINRVHAVNFSPAFGLINPADLADMILKSGKNIKLMLQMHKYIWHPDERAK